MPRHRAHTTTPIYPLNAWSIIEDSYDPAHNYRHETVFALANGTIGTRGTVEEGFISDGKHGLEGTYINGFYESEVIRYPEAAFGFAKHSQSMLNVANAKGIDLFVDGERFDLQTGRIVSYRRELNLQTGILTRRVQWVSPQGHEILVEITRCVSAVNRHLMVIQHRVTALNFAGEIRWVSRIDGDVKNLVTENDPRAGSGLQGRVLDVQKQVFDAQAGLGGMLQQTHHSNMRYACAMQHEIVTPYGASVTGSQSELSLTHEYRATVEANQPVYLNKFVAYVSNQHTHEDVLDVALRVVQTAHNDGYEAILQAHRAEFAEFWRKSEITIEGDDALQQGIRFNMFHLFQSVGRDGVTNIGAKGLTGEGYEGHYFWDTEMYAIPFFLHTRPDIARNLLAYRYHILDKARARALEMGHRRGALFAWRSINGEECSAYFPAGTAQYHLTADVAFAIKRYVEASGDEAFLLEMGAEILFESARLWIDLGVTIDGKGFCLNGVTGPDEYTAVVNNNAFTNLMAQENLYYAYHVAQWMREKHSEHMKNLTEKLTLWSEEIDLWRNKADIMYIPYDERRDLYAQDDSFFGKAVWDFANTPDDHYPLLLHYHPLVIYRYQVLKQADLILAMVLLGNRFTLSEKQRNFDYYEPITTHDSSLSSCIYSILANEIGYHEQAYRFFMETARMDLDDTHRNVKDGVHIANMAGTWLGLVNGFGGMRVQSDTLSFNPSLPRTWQRYAFTVSFRGCLVRVIVHPDEAHYELLEGETLTIGHGEHSITLIQGEPFMVGIS
jgi:trehalose/maltose hydrolase-like predicted phosphorylase